uniref:Protein transport protein sec16 n=1 Tax=Albugo laibachii Nc14 TaxID=890382 RepID=F0VYU9_9STRA|nr:COPII coat assembly protein SEC16 putative [Albugo laibachii Nc14]|eukprot:CCA13964.1 COPII coat assembly protein SEC16 putative [Albugo laibachii Nc14]
MEADTTHEPNLDLSDPHEHTAASSRSGNTSKANVGTKSDSQSLKLQFSMGVASVPPAVTPSSTREDFFASVGLNANRPISFGLHPPDPLEKLTKKQANLTVKTASAGGLAESSQNVANSLQFDSVKDPFSMDAKDEEFVQEGFSDSWSVDSPVIYSPRSDAPGNSVTAPQAEEIDIGDDEELTWNEKDDELIESDCITKASNISDGDLQWDIDYSTSIACDTNQSRNQLELKTEIGFGYEDTGGDQNNEFLTEHKVVAQNLQAVEDDRVGDIRNEMKTLSMKPMIQQNDDNLDDDGKDGGWMRKKIEDSSLDNTIIVEERIETTTIVYNDGGGVTTTTHTILETDGNYDPHADAASIYNECKTSSTEAQEVIDEKSRSNSAHDLPELSSEKTIRDELTDLLTQDEQSERATEENIDISKSVQNSSVNWSVQARETSAKNDGYTSYIDGFLYTTDSNDQPEMVADGQFSDRSSISANPRSTHAMSAGTQSVVMNTSLDFEDDIADRLQNDESYNESGFLEAMIEAEGLRFTDADSIFSVASTVQEDHHVDGTSAQLPESTTRVLSEVTMSDELGTGSRAINGEWDDCIKLEGNEGSRTSHLESRLTTIDTERNETAFISHDYSSPINRLTPSTSGAPTAEETPSTRSYGTCELNGFDPTNDSYAEVSSTIATFGGSDNTSESMYSSSCFSDYPSQTVSTTSNIDYTSSILGSEQALSQDGGDSEQNTRTETWVNAAVQNLNLHAGHSENVESLSVSESVAQEYARKIPVDSFLSAYGGSFENPTEGEIYHNVSSQDDTVSSIIESSFVPSAASLFGDTGDSGTIASFDMRHRNDFELQESNASAGDAFVEDASNLFGAATLDYRDAGSKPYETTKTAVSQLDDLGGNVNQNASHNVKDLDFDLSQQEVAIHQALGSSLPEYAKSQEADEAVVWTGQDKYIENNIALDQLSLCPSDGTAGVDTSQGQYIDSGDGIGEGAAATTIQYNGEEDVLSFSSVHHHFEAPSTGNLSYYEGTNNPFHGGSSEVRLDGAVESSSNFLQHGTNNHKTEATHSFVSTPPNSADEVSISSVFVTQPQINPNEADWLDQENAHLSSTESMMKMCQDSPAAAEGAATFGQSVSEVKPMNGYPDSFHDECEAEAWQNDGTSFFESNSSLPNHEKALAIGTQHFIETSSKTEQFGNVDSGDPFSSNSTKMDDSTLFQQSPPHIEGVFGHTSQPGHRSSNSRDWGNQSTASIPPSHAAMTCGANQHYAETTSIGQFGNSESEKDSSTDPFGYSSTHLNDNSLFQQFPPETQGVFGHDTQSEQRLSNSYDYDNHPCEGIPPTQDARASAYSQHYIEAKSIGQFGNPESVKDSSTDPFGYSSTHLNDSSLFQQPPPETQGVFGHDTQSEQRLSNSYDYDNHPCEGIPPTQDAMASDPNQHYIQAKSIGQFGNSGSEMDSNVDPFGCNSTHKNDNTLFQQPPQGIQKVLGKDTQSGQRILNPHDSVNRPSAFSQSSNTTNTGTWKTEGHSEMQNQLNTLDSQSQQCNASFFDTSAPSADELFANPHASVPLTLTDWNCNLPQDQAALPYSAQHASHHRPQTFDKPKVHLQSDYTIPESTAAYTNSTDAYSGEHQNTDQLFMSTSSHPSLPTQDFTRYAQSDTLSENFFSGTPPPTSQFQNDQQVCENPMFMSQTPPSNTVPREIPLKTQAAVSDFATPAQFSLHSGTDSHSPYTNSPTASQVSNVLRTEINLSSKWNYPTPSRNVSLPAQDNSITESQTNSPFSPTGSMVSHYGSQSALNVTQQNRTVNQNPEGFGVREKRYDDPTILPPSCLISFGFGGNVVSMFPKRKVRLANNLRRLQGSASALLDSPRGEELRKGPVQFYHISQLYPKKWFQDAFHLFPGPLTKQSHQEDIVRYLDTKLERSDEDERLLLGVLRVLLTCSNGKREEYTGRHDASTEENALVAVLQDSDERRRGNTFASFQPPSALQTESAEAHDRNTARIRSLLLNGDRRGAVEAAMRFHMWPEAMLIASFIEKEEYKRVLYTYFNSHYSIGDPSRALYMAFADQQQKSVYEPQALMRELSSHETPPSPILANWVSHAQMLIANKTADTNKILTELGDRLWHETNSVVSAHICYLLARNPIEAPSPNSRVALLGGDHRTNTEARFYVSPNAVQRTEIYEWIHKRANPGVNLIPFQGYKLIHAMILADHGEVETSLRYVTSMLEIVRGVTANMKPGTSMYLEGMQNQLVVLDDRLRQHLGRDRAESLTSVAGKPGGKWGLGSALSIVGKIVNRVVEGTDGLSPRANASTLLRQKSMSNDTPASQSDSPSLGTGQVTNHMDTPPGAALDPHDARTFSAGPNSWANDPKPAPLPVPMITPTPYQAPTTPDKALVDHDSMARYGPEPGNTMGPPPIATQGPLTGQAPPMLSKKMQVAADNPQMEVPAQMMRTSSFPVPGDRGVIKSGSPSDQGSPSQRPKDPRKKGRSKTPPPSSSRSTSSSGWFSGLSSFIATKINPEAKVAKLGEQMEAYFDEEKKQWIFPGETVVEETTTLGAPPVGLNPAGNGPPVGGSAPTSSSGGACATDSNDPLAALMAPPMSRAHASLVKMDPLAAMMAPPKRHGLHASRAPSEGPQKKKAMPPRPQFAVFKPMRTSATAASSSAPNSTNGSSPFPNSQKQ